VLARYLKENVNEGDKEKEEKGNAASIHIFDQLLAVSSFFSFSLCKFL
jgi:hypothetical protein